ncbi:MAG: 1-acyl-sn-glycerol-3-phosphate acyltransferase, partial [Bacteroidota bacterium]
IYDFQAKVVYPFLKAIEKSSISKLSFSGLENIDPNEKYLFVSNHRDIILDSAYLNLLLFENKITTSQIAIGDNLMRTRVSEILFRINKSFVVKRTGTARELYAASVALSTYIRDTIVEKKDSIWIAQREGRAKDGNDTTQQGLLKMISLCGRKNLKAHLQQLKIVPVSIAYEIDPTGLLKTQEYLRKIADPEFKKSFREDVNYMLEGIQGYKGRVHFSFGKVLLEELEILDTAENASQKIELLAQLIDKTIHQNYQLLPLNYVAYDLLKNEKKYANYYSEADWEASVTFFQEQINQLPAEVQQMGNNYLLGIYANPVINASAAQF